MDLLNLLDKNIKNSFLKKVFFANTFFNALAPNIHSYYNIITNTDNGGDEYMKKLSKLFELVEKESIIIEETNINHSNTKGLYLNIPGFPPTIFIDKSIINDRCRLISILSEELGHHFTTLGNLPQRSRSYSEKLQKNKKEKQAKYWAANFLISDEDFAKALCNCISTPCDICDCFNITDEILQYKIYSIVIDEKRYSKIKSILKKNEVAYEACCI